MIISLAPYLSELQINFDFKQVLQIDTENSATGDAGNHLDKH